MSVKINAAPIAYSGADGEYTTGNAFTTQPLDAYSQSIQEMISTATEQVETLTNSIETTIATADEQIDELIDSAQQAAQTASQNLTTLTSNIEQTMSMASAQIDILTTTAEQTVDTAEEQIDSLTTTAISNITTTINSTKDDALTEIASLMVAGDPTYVAPYIPTFSDAVSYKCGDYVLYQTSSELPYQIYRARADLPAQSWSLRCWELVSNIGNIGRTGWQRKNLFDAYNNEYTLVENNGSSVSNDKFEFNNGVLTAKYTQYEGARYFMLRAISTPNPVPAMIGPGTYTLSARILSVPGTGDNKYKLWMDIGVPINATLPSHATAVPMTFTRGGTDALSVNDTIPNEGVYVKFTTTLTQAYPWGIRLQPSHQANSGMIIDNIQLEEGNTLTAYEAAGQTSVDNVARNALNNLTDFSSDIAAISTDIEDFIRREKGTIYLGSGDTIDITSAGSGSIAVSFSGKLCFKLKGDNGGAKTWESISTNLTESQITIDGNSAIITIPNYRWLVYNTDDKQLYLRNNNGSGNYAIQRNDIVLLYNAYNQPVHGILHERWLDQKARSIEGETDTLETMAIMAEIFQNTNPIDCFLYFTDPHLKENAVKETQYKAWMNKLRDYAHQLPVNFTVCGGDWIGNSDTPADAITKLAEAYGTMKKNFNNFHLIMGNHDTNYQGISEEEKAAHEADPSYTAVRGTGKLDQQINNNLWYKGGKSYYTFDTPNARYIILDTGLEFDNFSTSSNHAYYLDEADWLAETLQSNTKEHIVLLQHIIYSSWAQQTVAVIADGFTKIANAYNTATASTAATATITGPSGNVTYTFNTAPAGHVDLCIAGHSHQDGTATINNIPCVVRTSMRYNGSSATTKQIFDIVTIDFTDKLAQFTRVGERGESLDFSFT